MIFQLKFANKLKLIIFLKFFFYSDIDFSLPHNLVKTEKIIQFRKYVYKR